MKRYEVEISDLAAADIRQAFEFIYEQSPQNGIEWLRNLYHRIDTLETMPNRCGLIRENDAFEDDVRELLHFSHRIIFTVDEARSLVLVHAVRHSARDALQGDEL